MARIKFPSTFPAVVKLFKDCKKKHDAQPAPKTLQPFLDEEGIDMAADLLGVTAAENDQKDFDKAAKEAEKLTRTRDNLFNPVWQDHEGAVQALKKLYRKNPQKLGDWGVTVNNGKRISYPADFTGRQAAVIAFINKHESFPPGASPLAPYLAENDIDLAANKLDAAAALTAHDNFLIQDNIRESKRIDRDTKIAVIEGHLRGEGQFLVGHFSHNPKKANEWGYEVDDSPQADKMRDVMLNPGEVKTIHDAVLKSVLEVHGPSAGTVFPGKTTAGTGVTINAGGTFIIKRTYGTFTIRNESNSQKLAITFTENR